MSATNDQSTGLSDLPSLPSAAELRHLIDGKRLARAEDAQHSREAMEDDWKQRHDLFMARKIDPAFIGLIMKRIRDAAEAGETEIQVGLFPSAWLTDGGRQINAPEPTWPETLQGFAKEFFDYWDRELKPKEFRLRVEIVTFPNGFPGDVGAFLSWKG